MGMRFRKSFGKGPFRVTISKSGVGYSVGGKGIRYTKKAGGGTRVTAGIPNTGVSYTKDYSSKKSNKTASMSKQSAKVSFAPKTKKEKTKKSGKLRIAFGVIYLIWSITQISVNFAYTVIGAALGVALIAWGVSARKNKTPGKENNELAAKLQNMSDQEFLEYEKSLLSYLQCHKGEPIGEDMKKLAKAIREEGERRSKPD